MVLYRKNNEFFHYDFFYKTGDFTSKLNDVLIELDSTYKDYNIDLIEKDFPTRGYCILGIALIQKTKKERI